MSELNERARTVLQTAIDAVYIVFAGYEAPQTLHAAPKHDVPKVLALLRSSPLRQLDAESLGPFAGSALYTIGDVTDYKHFLPRILELAVSCQTHMGLEPWAIARKLAYAGWLEWSQAEVTAIRALFQAAWQVLRLMTPEDGSAQAWLYANAMIGEDVTRMLFDWFPSAETGGLSQAADLISATADLAETIREDAPSSAISAVMAWRCRPELRQALLDGLDHLASDSRWEVEQALKILAR